MKCFIFWWWYSTQIEAGPITVVFNELFLLWLALFCGTSSGGKCVTPLLCWHSCGGSVLLCQLVCLYVWWWGPWSCSLFSPLWIFLEIYLVVFVISFPVGVHWARVACVSCVHWCLVPSFFITGGDDEVLFPPSSYGTLYWRLLHLPIGVGLFAL